MEVKLFEIRDRGTLIPAMAISVSREDGPIARRAGYGKRCILLAALNAGGNIQYDPYAWGGRTYPAAHHWIINHWDDLINGQVIDVRVILGEAEHAAEPECV